MSFGYAILIILLMLFVNAVFAAYEMALASISRSRLSTLCQHKKRGAEQAAYMKDRMEASLTVIQLGITLAGAIAAATGGVGAQELFTPFFAKMGFPLFYTKILAIICIVIPLSAFTITFAELVPKMFALKNRESVCLVLSPVMKAIVRIAHPIVSLFEITVKKTMRLKLTRLKAGAVPLQDKQSLHELNAAVALARTSRLIGAHEEKIVLSAAQLSQRKVAEIMIDIEYVSVIPVTDSISNALIKVHLDMHTRFPVCENAGEPQTIIGYLNFKDIVKALQMNPGNPSVQGITRPVKKISAETPLSQALSEMMHEKAHIAIIVSPEQVVLGMITLEDIIEELVGEIEDEFDRLPTHVHPYGTGWIVGGAVPIKTIASMLGVEIPLEDTSKHTPTLAEWVTQKLDRDIKGGESLSFDNISVTVRKLRRRKLAEAFVSKV